MKLKRSRQRLNLQAKIILILVAVIIPTFVIVTVAENKFTRPILEEDIRQVGITSAKTLAAEIVSSKLLFLPNPVPAIEARIQELIYSQPSIIRVDVVGRDPLSGLFKPLGSNIEEEPGGGQTVVSLTEAVVSEHKTDESGASFWEISVPIEQKGRDSRSPKRLVGTVHLVMSLKLVGQILNTVWRTTASAAAFSVVMLLLTLSYLLRKTIANDRKLRLAESQNIQLTEQLHDAQRQLMNMEKLAVMGQLTASFAHEIGTPLNAIGGHLQLLKEESPNDRVDIIGGQVAKIEEIVKGFLQSTAKPSSQRQLSDVNQLVDRTLGILKPRIDAEKVEIRRHFNREMGPLRVVPLDLEQVLLNLLNNSLDSLKAKALKSKEGRERLAIEVSTDTLSQHGREWAQILVYDTGEGIRKADLENVLKPFFTTKPPGEGTGLGLAICQQLLQKYGGVLKIDSKEGAWTRVTIQLPYHTYL